MHLVLQPAEKDQLISVSPGPSPRHSRSHRRNVSDTAALQLPDPNRESAFRSVFKQEENSGDVELNSCHCHLSDSDAGFDGTLKGLLYEPWCFVK